MNVVLPSALILRKDGAMPSAKVIVEPSHAITDPMCQRKNMTRPMLAKPEEALGLPLIKVIQRVRKHSLKQV